MVLNTAHAAVLGFPCDWHVRLVRALASRDPDLAARTMREHVQFNVAKQLELLLAGDPAQLAKKARRSRAKFDVSEN